MGKKNFFILFAMVLWIWMIVRTFFWWNDKSPEELEYQAISTWFIQEITETGDTINIIEPVEKDNWDIQKQEKKDYIEIKVVMPKYFYNLGRKNFAEDFYNDNKIYMNFIFIDDLNSYRDQLLKNDDSFWDVFLFPYDRIEKISLYKFTTTNNVERFFDEMISPIAKGNQISFIPFSADPMIMYTSWYNQHNNFIWISNFSDSYTNDTTYIPVFFGIDYYEKDNKWSSREYQDIVRYALMHYFQTYQDKWNMETRININTSEKYELNKINKIIRDINSKECNYFPSICLQINNYVWVRFWFISDIDIMNKYFSKKKSLLTNIVQSNLPFSSIESPVRIRWRWISWKIKDNDKISASEDFIIQYMTKNDEYNLWNSTLPVFKNEGWNWLINNNYIWPRWYILKTWWDYLRTLRWINKFRDLISYKIEPKDFLR